MPICRHSGKGDDTLTNNHSKRNYNFDLLKILAMLLIILVHSFSKSGLRDCLLPGTWNYYTGNLLYTPGLVATNCFVMVSGYFLCTSKFKLKKLLSIWAQVLFYSVFLFIFVVILIPSSFSFIDLIQSILAITTKQYWFATAYILLYIFFPFINIAIHSMGKRMHLLLCCVLILIFTIIDNIIFFSDFSGITSGYSFLWFCVIYILAAYLRLYVPERIHYQRFMLPLYIICIVLVTLTYFTGTALLGTSDLGQAISSLFYTRNSILLLPATLFLFQYIRGLTITGKNATRLISLLMPSVFGVYLIHDNPFLYPLLWDALGTAARFDSPFMLLFQLLQPICIFAVCALADTLRRRLFRLLHIDSTLDSLGDKLQSLAENKLYMD